MKPLPLNPLFRALDYLMIPLMYLISGTYKERPQESHIWHGQNIPEDNLPSIDKDLSVASHSHEISTRKHGGILFHLPIFGGWKDYTVLESENFNSEWYIGWIVRNSSSNSVTRFQVHKLPLTDSKVRMLTGNSNYSVMFFAVNTQGVQIPLKEVATGRIGDGKFPNIRLL